MADGAFDIDKKSDHDAGFNVEPPQGNTDPDPPED